MTLPDDTALRGWVDCPRCGDAVRVIRKGDRIGWFPSVCRGCKAPFHDSQDFSMETFTSEDDET